jgi:hypothetical protein
VSERPSGTTLKKHKSQPPPPTSSPPGAEICSPLARTGLTAAQRASRRSSSTACCPLCPGTTTPRFAPIRGGSFVPPSNPQAGLAVRRRTDDAVRHVSSGQNPPPTSSPPGFGHRSSSRIGCPKRRTGVSPKENACQTPPPTLSPPGFGMQILKPDRLSVVGQTTLRGWIVLFGIFFGLKPGGCPTQDQRFCEARSIFKWILSLKPGGCPTSDRRNKRSKRAPCPKTKFHWTSLRSVRCLEFGVPATQGLFG